MITNIQIDDTRAYIKTYYEITVLYDYLQDQLK